MWFNRWPITRRLCVPQSTSLICNANLRYANGELQTMSPPLLCLLHFILFYVLSLFFNRIKSSFTFLHSYYVNTKSPIIHLSFIFLFLTFFTLYFPPFCLSFLLYQTLLYTLSVACVILILNMLENQQPCYMIQQCDSLSFSNSVVCPVNYK